MKEEKTFMMIFRFTPNFEAVPTPQEQEHMAHQCGSFIGNVALKEKLIGTHQFGFEGKQIAMDGSVSEGILIADKQTVGGIMIVRSQSLEEATEIAKDCPILKMGGSVEIRNIIPMNH